MKRWRFLVLALTLCAPGAPSLSTAQQPAAAPSSPAATPAPATIHQEVDFEVGPQHIYEALLDEKQFSAFSGRAATIDPRLGGASSLFGGHIIARNVELVPNQRIVQAWRVVT